MTLGKHAAWYSLNWHDLPLPPFAAMNGYRYRTSFSTRVFPFLVSWLFLSSVRNNYDKWTSRQRPTSEMCLEGGDQKLFNVFETHSQTRKRSCGKFFSQFYNVTLRKLFPSNNKWKFPFFSFSSILFHKNNSVSQFARQGNTFLASNTVYVTMLPRLSFFGRGRRGEWNIIGFKIARKVPEGLPERLSLHVQRVCTRDQRSTLHQNSHVTFTQAYLYTEDEIPSFLFSVL